MYFSESSVGKFGAQSSLTEVVKASGKGGVSGWRVAGAFFKVFSAVVFLLL